eukprot:gene48083-63442_t
MSLTGLSIGAWTNHYRWVKRMEWGLNTDEDLALLPAHHKSALVNDEGMGRPEAEQKQAPLNASVSFALSGDTPGRSSRPGTALGDSKCVSVRLNSQSRGDHLYITSARGTVRGTAVRGTTVRARYYRARYDRARYDRVRAVPPIAVHGDTGDPTSGGFEGVAHHSKGKVDVDGLRARIHALRSDIDELVGLQKGASPLFANGEGAEERRRKEFTLGPRLPLVAAEAMVIAGIIGCFFVDWSTTAKLRPRVWILVILGMDCLLLLEAREALVAVGATMTTVWLLVTTVEEAAVGATMTTVWLLVTTVEEAAVGATMTTVWLLVTTVEEAAGVGLYHVGSLADADRLATFLIDLTLTRFFSKTMRAEQRQMQSAVAVAGSVAACLAQYGETAAGWHGAC